jgi:hypothetical protein
MNFPSWKASVEKLAKNKVYMLPGDNTLFLYWERGFSPVQVVQEFCR